MSNILPHRIHALLMLTIYVPAAKPALRRRYKFYQRQKSRQVRVQFVGTL